MATTITDTAPDYAASVQRWLDGCTTADAMVRTAKDVNRKALAEWARQQGLTGNLARMPKPELAQLVADTAWQLRTGAEAPEATPEPEADPEPTPEPEATPEPPMAGTIEALQAEKRKAAPKAKAGTAQPRTAAVGRYAEAQAARKAAADKRPGGGTKVTDAELAELVRAELAEYPELPAYQALEVLYWLNGLALSKPRFARVWAEVQGPEAPEAEPQA